MVASAIVAVVLALLALDAATAAERVPGRTTGGRLVAVDRTWWSVPAPAERRLCLTVENRDDRVAQDVAAWVEIHGGEGPMMRRLRVARFAVEPGTLAPGESGGVCLDTPPEVRGIFVRLRARWLAAVPARSGSEAAPRP